MSDSQTVVGSQEDQSPCVPKQKFRRSKPVVVGIYGVPGSGKTHLLDELKTENQLGEKGRFLYVESSQMIGNSGLDGFQTSDEPGKIERRQQTIENVKHCCTFLDKVGIVAGDFMFWVEGQEPEVVWTDADAGTLTHVIYLDVSTAILANRHNDRSGARPWVSENHLGRWQMEEEKQLRQLCYDHSILFIRLCPEMAAKKCKMLIKDFVYHSERSNRRRAEANLDAVFKELGRPSTILMLDADRTLNAGGTSAMYWEGLGDKKALDAFFSGQTRNTYTAFRQAALLYEEKISNEKVFDDRCSEIASDVLMHQKFIDLLTSTVQEADVGAVIVTCGLKIVWRKVLERLGLSRKVGVIAGNRVADGFVVTPQVKGALGTRLQDHHQAFVLAFGDGPLDLEMLKTANQAVVVVAEKNHRSETMDAALLKTMDEEDLQAHQTLLPRTATPRLDTRKFPLINLRDQTFMHSVFGHRLKLQVTDATESKTTKLLASRMHDSTNTGQGELRAHHQAGFHLASEYLTDVIGVEPVSLQHDKGPATPGFRLLNEEKTTIMALMPTCITMADGIHEAFPTATVRPAKDGGGVETSHLDEKKTVVVVNSVINTEKTVVNAVKQICEAHATIRIVVVAELHPTECLKRKSPLQELASYSGLHIVAFRLSPT